MKQLSVLGVSSLAILMGVTACQKPAEKPADTAATSSATTAASADMPQIRIATESSFVPFSSAHDKKSAPTNFHGFGG